MRSPAGLDPVGKGKVTKVPMVASVRACVFAEQQIGIGAMARALRRNLVPTDGLEVRWVDVTYEASGGMIERLPLPRSLRGPLRGLRQTSSGIRQGPFDSLLFITHNPAVLRPATLWRTRSCLWTDVTPIQLDQLAAYYQHDVDPAPLRLFKRGAVTLAFRLAARCLAWSEWARRSFVRDYGVPEERTAVVPPGVEMELFNPPAAGERAGREGPVRLLFVGGHFERKGGRLLLEALQDQPAGRFVLDVVTRDEVPELPWLRVHRGLAPHSEELRRLYREADLFVLPTLADCHSIASIEAMACGLPVVLTTVGAGAEIVDDGVSGRLVPPRDVRALREALEDLARDRQRLSVMGARSRAIAVERFDARQTAARLLGYLQEAATAGAR
jgi:glycosyltransferase involved in cell wall biosynthesis